MKRIFAILLFVTNPCLAQTFVSTAGYEDISGAGYATVNVVFNSGVAAGNAVACYVRYGNSGNPGLTVAVTGPGSEKFTQAGVNAEVNANSWSGLYVVSNSAGGTPYNTKITFSPANYAAYIAVVCAQYSAPSSTLLLDQTAQGVKSNASFCATGTFSTTVPSEVVIVGASGGPPYAANGFTLRGTSGSGSVAALLDKNVTSTQNNASATVTGQSFEEWDCNLATLAKAAQVPPSVSMVRSRSTSY